MSALEQELRFNIINEAGGEEDGPAKDQIKYHTDKGCNMQIG